MVLHKIVSGAAGAGTGARVLARSGVVRPYSPLVLARLARTLQTWGPGPAGGFTALAIREPDRIGLVDELGSLSFAQLHARSNALAHALAALGVGEGDGVAIMARNHRGFVEATVAAAKLGADLLYLNTAFAGPQLEEVLERDRPMVLIHDEEFAELVAAAQVQHTILAWHDDAATDVPTLEALIARFPDSDLRAPRRHARVVILTSGTTGTPRGAPRSEAGVGAAVALLEAMPMRFGWRTHIAAPLFHTWGFAHLALSMLLGSTVVLQRRFDPESCLRVLQQERCESVVVIPVMLQRILALPAMTLEQHDLSRVEVVASSGSALPGDLARIWMDRFGDHLYSTYGSTEVAYVSIARPADLRAAPSSAGFPARATTVKIFDDAGEEVPAGEAGRIFVGNGLLFEGYTGGGVKDMIGPLMSTGDVGRFGQDGRLYVEGRDDEMIVSGGENVFPREIEDCLARHPCVVEAAAVGVDDEEYGARLRAFVVLDEDSCDEETLKAWVKDHLARYKVPREIVLLDELPRNATGKVLKRDLVEQGGPGA